MKGMVKIMKKIIALFLVVGMTAALFASCKTTETNETTTNNNQTTETTTVGSGETSTSATIIRTVKDQNTNQNIGVAIFNWKQDKATANIVFDSEYTMTDGTKLPVLQIGVGQGILSFQNDLKSITVPASVDKIAKKAFSFCSELETIVLAEGLESIGEMAFWACKSLESISIPSTVTEIGTNAFAGCENLKSVTLPRAFESEIANIFEGCPADMVITYID